MINISNFLQKEKRKGKEGTTGRKLSSLDSDWKDTFRDLSRAVKRSQITESPAQRAAGKSELGVKTERR